PRENPPGPSQKRDRLRAFDASHHRSRGTQRRARRQQAGTRGIHGAQPSEGPSAPPLSTNQDNGREADPEVFRGILIPLGSPWGISGGPEDRVIASRRGIRSTPLDAESSGLKMPTLNRAWTLP